MFLWFFWHLTANQWLYRNHSISINVIPHAILHQVLSLRSKFICYDISITTPMYLERLRNEHGVWKSQKKSHSTLRAKRATFTFWMDKSWLKMPKVVHFVEFLKTWSLRSNSVTRQVSFNRTKIGGKCQNSNATFWVIFKQCSVDFDFLSLVRKLLQKTEMHNGIYFPPLDDKTCDFFVLPWPVVQPWNCNIVQGWQ